MAGHCKENEVVVRRVGRNDTTTFPDTTEKKQSGPARLLPLLLVPTLPTFCKGGLRCLWLLGSDSRAVGVPKFRRRNFGTYHHLCYPCHSFLLCPTPTYPSSPS